MPSLFRYFAVVGSTLFGLLLFVNYLVGPAPEPVVQAKPEKLAVEHDPRASLIERWRDEQAARKAAERGEPAVASTPAPAPVSPAVEPAQAEPVQAEAPQLVAPAALHTAAAEPVPDADTAKAEKLKAAQARKARIVRERARAKREEEAASRRQDQFFYGYGQPRPAYAEAPTFDPFGFGRAR